MSGHFWSLYSAGIACWLLLMLTIWLGAQLVAWAWFREKFEYYKRMTKHVFKEGE